MKVKVAFAFFITALFIVVSSASADGNDKMSKWAGVSRVDSFVNLKVQDSKNSTSIGGNIIVYPWIWANENGANLLGVGYKANYWGSDSGYGQRHLGQVAFRGYHSWGDYRLSALAGVQNESYGKSKPRYNLYGVGAYTSLHHRDAEGKRNFPKTEFWGQALWADGRNPKATTDSIIDIGGRQYLYEGWRLKPFIEANLSVGTSKKYANLGVGVGLTDKNEILYLSVGPNFDLQHGGNVTFVNAGLDTSNLVSTVIRYNAAKQVEKVNP